MFESNSPFPTLSVDAERKRALAAKTLREALRAAERPSEGGPGTWDQEELEIALRAFYRGYDGNED